MNFPSPRRLLLALLVTAATTTGSFSYLSAQPAPPASSDNTLPPNIDPASPTAQIIKLVQAGTDISVIDAYVANSSGSFNLDADTIVSLKDAGVPTEVINAMMSHDKSLGAPAPAPAPEPAPVPDNTQPTAYAPAPDNTIVDSSDTAPPTTPVTVEYFDNTLTPYGSWVQVNGYGRCWRPTVVVYDNTWSPYCDRGHWVYTSCGWYWNSDYSWGSTFHYGRWFRDTRWGWCWYPDTTWAPSWVVWRSADTCCGWAPLPPFAVFTPGVGFFFRGARVSVDFDFGLRSDCFVFLSPDHLCDRRPRSFCLNRPHVGAVFNHTTIINNYHYDDHSRTVVNIGVPVKDISARSHRLIQPVDVGSLPNARREGWQGAVTVHQSQNQNTSNDHNQFHGTAPGNGSDNHNQQSNSGHNPSPSNPGNSTTTYYNHNQNHSPEPTYGNNQNQTHYGSQNPTIGSPTPSHNPPVTTSGNGAANSGNNPSHNHLSNQNTMNTSPSGTSHAPTYTPPATTAPAPNNNNYQNQNNNHFESQNGSSSPSSSSHYSSPSYQQRFQQTQSQSQSQSHYSGSSSAHYNSAPSSGAPPSSSSSQGSSHNSSSNSGQDRQGH